MSSHPIDHNEMSTIPTMASLLPARSTGLTTAPVERLLRACITYVTAAAVLFATVAIGLYFVEWITEQQVRVPLVATGATGELASAVAMLGARVMLSATLRAYLTEKAATQALRR